MTVASCCCGGGQFQCESWRACMPQKVRVEASSIQQFRKFQNGIPFSTVTITFTADLELVKSATGLEMISNGQGTWSWSQEEIENQLIQGFVFEGDPACLSGCGAQVFCRRLFAQASGDFSIGNPDLATAAIICVCPCDSFGSGSCGFSHTRVAISVAQAQGTFNRSYGTDPRCPFSGLPGEFGSITAPPIGFYATDVVPQCIGDFFRYVGLSGIVGGCGSTAFIGFECQNGQVVSASPSESWSITTCPFYVCQDLLCLGPDPNDPLNTIVLNECGCDNLSPGSGYTNSNGEVLYYENTTNDSTCVITVLEP